MFTQTSYYYLFLSLKRYFSADFERIILMPVPTMRYAQLYVSIKDRPLINIVKPLLAAPSSKSDSKMQKQIVLDWHC